MFAVRRGCWFGCCLRDLPDDVGTPQRGSDITRFTWVNCALAKAISHTIALEFPHYCVCKELWNAQVRAMDKILGTHRAAPPFGLSRPARPPGIPADPTAMPELGCASELDDFA